MNSFSTSIILILYNAFAIFCCWLCFKWGYNKKLRDEQKERERIWKKYQETLPKAINREKSKHL